MLPTNRHFRGSSTTFVTLFATLDFCTSTNQYLCRQINAVLLSADIHHTQLVTIHTLKVRHCTQRSWFWVWLQREQTISRTENLGGYTVYECSWDSLKIDRLLQVGNQRGEICLRNAARGMRDVSEWLPKDLWGVTVIKDGWHTIAWYTKWRQRSRNRMACWTLWSLCAEKCN